MHANKLVVVSNPRSGTSLLVNLLLAGFGLPDKNKVVPIEGDYTDVYAYRRDIGDIDFSDSSTRAIVIIRDPRAVITSKHPSSPNTFFMGFDVWYNNFLRILDKLYCTGLHLVWFDDLVRKPYYVQKHISNFLSLPVVVPFSECHHIFGKLNMNRENEMLAEAGGIRGLDYDKIYRWKGNKYKDRLSEQYKLNANMEDVIGFLGYNM